MVFRPVIGLALASVALVLIAACGSDNGGQPGAGQPTATASPAATPVSGQDTGAPPAGGLDPACVQNVLGRQVTGFADMTSAEREQVFSVCSPQGGTPQPGFFNRPPGGGFFNGAGIDFDCASDLLDKDVKTFQDVMNLSDDERQQVFEKCSDGPVFTGTPGPGGFPQFGQGGQFGPGQGSFQAQIDPACAEQALGRPVDDITQLTQEERRTVAQACFAPSGNGNLTLPTRVATPAQ